MISEKGENNGKSDHDTGNHVRSRKEPFGSRTLSDFTEDGFRTALLNPRIWLKFLYYRGWTGNGTRPGGAGGGGYDRASVYMNPILLKPTTDTGSQVIVNGEVIGNMSAREYFA